jgi:uncharacterized membrane protein YozB (DUF420 family)
VNKSDFWRSVIRILAVMAALLGLVLIANEILENIRSCNVGACTRIHALTMAWGIVLLALGMLVLQKGDVSMSLRDLRETGNAVATWFGRRAYDRKSGAIAAVTTPGAPLPHAQHEKGEDA